MKEEYIKQIMELLNKCQEIALLDLILKILQKGMQRNK